MSMADDYVSSNPQWVTAESIAAGHSIEPNEALEDMSGGPLGMLFGSLTKKSAINKLLGKGEYLDDLVKNQVPTTKYIKDAVDIQKRKMYKSDITDGQRTLRDNMVKKDLPSGSRTPRETIQEIKKNKLNNDVAPRDRRYTEDDLLDNSDGYIGAEKFENLIKSKTGDKAKANAWFLKNRR